MINKKEASRYILIGVLLLLVVLSILILRPFISVFLLSALLAFLFYPLHKRLVKHVRFKSLSAFLVTLLIVAVIAIPVLLFAYLVFNEVFQMIQGGVLASWIFQVSNFLGSTPVSQYLPTVLNEFAKYAANSISAIFVAVPKYLLNVLILMFSTFYFLLTGEQIVKRIKSLLPISNKDQILIEIKKSIHALIFGFFAVALIGFVIAAGGLYLLGVPSPIFWAFIMAVLVLIPGIGATLIYIPMAIIYAFQGNYWVGLLILLGGWGISAIETFGRPYFSGKRSAINPVLVLFGIFGGLVVFGAVGLIVGPVVLSITITLIEGFMKK